MKTREVTSSYRRNHPKLSMKLVINQVHINETYENTRGHPKLCMKFVIGQVHIITTYENTKSHPKLCLKLRFKIAIKRDELNKCLQIL